MKQVDTDTSSSISSNEFNWVDSGTPDSQAYLAPVVLSEIRKIVIKYPGKQLKVLDLGCGNGVFSARLANEGYQVNACDHSISGVEVAKSQLPLIDFFQQDINKELPEQYKGQFDIVVSLEVIEHLFQPRALFDRAKEALSGQGTLIVSTPYHGYAKNLALALFNKFDDHWHPLRDFGHIKFFSKNTLLQCFRECGFFVNSFARVGRIPALAKSMIFVAELKE
jgi:2-polyprenyl-3-methyl-5-hydroxy-6-metoxy-1,4-benzoquinol methylase